MSSLIEEFKDILREFKSNGTMAQDNRTTNKAKGFAQACQNILNQVGLPIIYIGKTGSIYQQCEAVVALAKKEELL